MISLNFLFLSVCVVNGPLGMTTGEIKDFQIKSSNSYPQEWDKFCHEKYGRVYMPNKYGWCAKYKSPSEWLMVDLGVAAKVSCIYLYLYYVAIFLSSKCYYNTLRIRQFSIQFTI